MAHTTDANLISLLTALTGIEKVKHADIIKQHNLGMKTLVDHANTIVKPLIDAELLNFKLLKDQCLLLKYTLENEIANERLGQLSTALDKANDLVNKNCTRIGNDIEQTHGQSISVFSDIDHILSTRKSQNEKQEIVVGVYSNYEYFNCTDLIAKFLEPKYSEKKNGNGVLKNYRFKFIDASLNDRAVVNAVHGVIFSYFSSSCRINETISHSDINALKAKYNCPVHLLILLTEKNPYDKYKHDKGSGSIFARIMTRNGAKEVNEYAGTDVHSYESFLLDIYNASEFNNQS